VHINIDLVQVRETARRGVRRTAVFLGLGLNAARDPRLVDFQLADLSPISLLPSAVPDETLAHFKSEYARWTTTCGLRELIETFAVFLDQVHHALLLMATNKHQITEDDAAIWGRAFPFKGIDDKLKKLKNRFSVQPSHASHLASVQQLRNCFTHRRGIVGLDDCQNGTHLAVSWMGFDAFGEHEGGETVELMLPLTEPVHFPNGGTIGFRYTERTRLFPLGSRVEVDPRDLLEICNFVLWSADEITDATGAYARAIGIAERPHGRES